MPVDMKTVISNTFVSMARQRGIDKITVKALIDTCNISRQSFYYHFRDIMEVIEWTMERATKNTLDKSLEADTPEQAFGILFSAVVEDRILVLKLLNSQRREQIEKLFVQSVRTYLQELIRNKPHNISLDYADIEVALDFWAFGIAGLLFKCCEQNQTDAKGLAKQICRLLPEKNDQDKK